MGVTCNKGEVPEFLSRRNTTNTDPPPPLVNKGVGADLGVAFVKQASIASVESVAISNPVLATNKLAADVSEEGDSASKESAAISGVSALNTVERSATSEGSETTDTRVTVKSELSTADSAQVSKRNSGEDNSIAIGDNTVLETGDTGEAGMTQDKNNRRSKEEKITSAHTAIHDLELAARDVTPRARDAHGTDQIHNRPRRQEGDANNTNNRLRTEDDTNSTNPRLREENETNHTNHSYVEGDEDETNFTYHIRPIRNFANNRTEGDEEVNHTDNSIEERPEHESNYINNRTGRHEGETINRRKARHGRWTINTNNINEDDDWNNLAAVQEETNQANNNSTVREEDQANHTDETITKQETTETENDEGDREHSRDAIAAEGDTRENGNPEKKEDGEEDKSDVEDDGTLRENINNKRQRGLQGQDDEDTEEEDSDEDYDDEDDEEGGGEEDTESLEWVMKMEDREKVLKSLSAVHLVLQVRSKAPLTQQHIDLTHAHFRRWWWWWRLAVRRRGRTSNDYWLCLLPSLTTTTQAPRRPRRLVSREVSEEGENSANNNDDNNLAQEDWCEEVRNYEMQRESRFGGPLCWLTLVSTSQVQPASDVQSVSPTAHTTDDTKDQHDSFNSGDKETEFSNPGESQYPAESSVSVGVDMAASTNSRNTNYGTLGKSDKDGTSEAISEAGGYKNHLLLALPRAFLDTFSPEDVCNAVVTHIDKITEERIAQEAVRNQEQNEDEQGKSRNEQEASKSNGQQETESIESAGDTPKQCKESKNQKKIGEVKVSIGEQHLTWLQERLEVGEVENQEESSKFDLLIDEQSSVDNENCDNTLQTRTIDEVNSRNFINKCKAERMTYVSGFTTCISTAAVALLKFVDEVVDHDQMMTRLRVSMHHDWPSPSYEWHDSYDARHRRRQPIQRPSITLTAPPRENTAQFWETARQAHKKRWEVPAVIWSETPEWIHLAQSNDDDGRMQFQPPRYPQADICMTGLKQKYSEELVPKWVGQRVALFACRTISPLKHFLHSHNIQLMVNEDSESISFSLRTYWRFPKPFARRFADEIVAAMTRSLASR